MALLDMADNELVPGKVVWADGVVGFPGEVMKARVMAPPVPGAGMLHFERHGRIDRAECVWLEQLPTPAKPIQGEPWVTPWPARKVLAV